MLLAASSALTFPLLTASILVPMVGALVLALLPRTRPELIRPTALLFATTTGAFTLWMLGAFDRHDAGFQFATKHTWVEEFGIGWNLGVDGISLFLVVLTGVLFPLTFVAITPKHDPKPYYAWLLLLQAGCIGAFAALDLFLFFIFFEIVLVPMYFLIGRWGYGERIYAALKFFLYTMFGSALMLVGLVALAFIHRDDVASQNEPLREELAALTESVELRELNGIEVGQPELDRIEELQATVGDGGDLTFDLVEIAEGRAAGLAADREAGVAADDSWNPLDWGAAKWIFIALAIGFAVKVPLFPLHTWLPDAHTQAPTAGSVILAGVMLKLGTYGFVRFGLYLLPDAAYFFAPVIATLGVIGILYGAIVATMQRDIKRLIAYSSVAHLGFIALGTFAMTRQGIGGGVLQMVNHGISTGALFLLLGMLYERRHTYEISAMSGLQKATPVLAGVFTLVMLSSIGLPGLNGFVGEFLILAGSYLTLKWWAVVAGAGVILAAVYLLWAYQRVFHGTPTEEDLATPDMRPAELAYMAPFLVLIVFLGVYPKPMLERIEPSVAALVEHIEGATDFEEPGSATSGFSAELVGGNDHGEGE